MKHHAGITIGTHVKVWAHNEKGRLIQVGSGYVRVMGMGVLKVQAENSHNTQEFSLQAVMLERIEAEAKPLFI